MTGIVKEARALLAQATPGEWFKHRDMLSNDYQVHVEGDVVALVWGTDSTTASDNAALIAAAPRLLAALADECERLRSASVQPATFGELNHPTIVKLVDEIPEHPGALGYQITDDDAHHVFVRTGAPRLGMITTLVHEMMHAAEGASGYSIPHSYVAMASFGATVALARCGVLGATDEEIDAFVEYVAGLDRSDDEDRDDEVMVDPVEECERLRDENARLREAIVEAMYWERCAAHEDTVEGRYSPYTLAEYAREDSVIERLDAAKEGR